MNQICLFLCMWQIWIRGLVAKSFGSVPDNKGSNAAGFCDSLQPLAHFVCNVQVSNSQFTDTSAFIFSIMFFFLWNLANLVLSCRTRAMSCSTDEFPKGWPLKARAKKVLWPGPSWLPPFTSCCWYNSVAGARLQTTAAEYQQSKWTLWSSSAIFFRSGPKRAVHGLNHAQALPLAEIIAWTEIIAFV